MTTLTIDQTGAAVSATPTFERATTNADGSFKVTNLNGGQAKYDLSNQWLRRPRDQRFLTLSDLAANVKARADETYELKTDTKKIEFWAPEPKRQEDTHVLKLITPDGDEVEPTHWSFRQIAGLAKAPADYLRTLPSQITADALMYNLRYNREGQGVKLYARKGKDIRAATGTDYGRIFDHEVVSAVQQIAGEGTGDMRWKIPGVMDWSTMVYNPNVAPTLDSTTLYASDRDVFIFLVDDRNPIVVGKTIDPLTKELVDDVMFRGFYISNSEVGSGALKIAVFYLRAICCNRIMWGTEGFEELTMRHTKYAPARFVEEARPALLEMCERSDTKLIEAVARAKEAKVAKDKDSALDFLQARGFSRRQSVLIYDTVEKEESVEARSAWDMAQGITAVARSIPYQDERVQMERAAKAILDRAS